MEPGPVDHDSMPEESGFSVEQISSLARIQLGQDQIETTRSDLQKLLKLVGVLNELELESIQPFFGSVNISSTGQIAEPVRPDETVDSISRDEILKNAPDSDGEFYLVPPVFD